ncbi:hypothetical protein NW759_000942 [Fusarium solani]|uniref:Ankyrin repeat-containing domain protein n=1 Tax=Fusarium solani TaxID=169388 RepID=A0A9P9RBD9_FUSSL|nr:ankyrin repeat-containing domain protein [Fusarium solani]KAH7272303.1 ankyrin repeat-containing domain protein [Fusarium solani]KAJ4235857.1 hypothetical protein NW759_000942 [Fusarium solani]
MSSKNHLIKLSQDVLLVLCGFLDTDDLIAAAQVKPLNYAATWTLHHGDVKYGWGPKKHTRALSWGAYKGYESVVTMALKIKSPIAESPFFDGYKYRMRGNAMHVTASQGLNHIIQILLDHGGDINSWTRTEKITVAYYRAGDFHRSMSPLYTAIDRDHQHTVKFLLNKGASLIVEKPDFSRPCVPSPQRRLNAMHIAAKYGQYHLIRYLHREYGIDLDLPDQVGNTALAYAMVSSENLRAIQYLISEGANLALMDDGGFTPLHRAITLPDAEEAKPIVAALIDAGADIDAFTNSVQTTPITIAIRFTQSSLIAMLVDAFHLRLALRAENLDDETRDDISTYVDALLHRRVPKYSDHHVKLFLKENNVAADEILYSRGIGLPDESPEGVNELLQVILDLPPTEYEDKSLTFLLTHYRDIIRGSKPEKVIAKLLASRHMSREAIVNLMNPSINIKWRGKKGKTLLHIFAENMRWHTRASDFSVLHALLDRGTNVNARAKGGLAALHILVADNYVSSGSDEVWFAKVLDLLLSKGLDINAVDNKGWTALDYLSNSQVVDRCAHRVGALVQRGLNADIRDTVASRRRPRSHPRRVR